MKAYLEDTLEFFDSSIIKEYNSLGTKSCSKESKVSFLARQLLEDKFPSTNDIEDIVSLVQIYEGVVASVYDYEKVDGDPVLDRGRSGEVFEGISLTGRELVLRDDAGIISLVPCFDSSRARVSRKTSELLVVVLGNSETPRSQLIDAMTAIVQRILYVAGGKISSMVYLD